MSAQATTAYDRARRFLLCEQCGAPVEIAAGSTQTACGYCRAPLLVRMRPEAAATAPRARDEAERLELLAAQDRRFSPPAALAHLFAGERIAPSREAEARSRWQELGQALRRSHDDAMADQLFVLTLGLSELCFDRSDVPGQRALIESCLLATGAPRHEQVLRAQLARSALRAGDPVAAEAWLAACDPRSEDLLSDTAYRFARAYLDTARSDLAAVIRVLGVGADVPLSHAYAPECAALSANAWERTGQRATAIDVLLSAKRELGPIARRRIQRFIAAHVGWQLCPASEHEAERRAMNMDPLPIQGETIATIVILVLGSYSLLWAASAILLSLAGDSMPVAEFSMSLITGGCMGILIFPIGVLMLLARHAEKRIDSRRIPHAAHVLERSVVGAADRAECTLIRLGLLITPDDAPAYRSTLETQVLSEMLDNFAPGSILIASVHRRDPHDYTLEVVSWPR